MVEGIVIRPALDDLIERDGCRVVAVGASSKDRIVFDVGPGFEVPGRGQPDPLVSALVEEIPRAVLEPGRRGAVRAGTDRRPVGRADVERAMIGPVHTVSRTQPVRDIVLTLGKHLIGTVLLGDAHILDPRVDEDRAVRVASPVRSIARRRMAQGHCVWSVAIVPGVPEVEDPVVSHQDRATLANLAVPGVRSGSGKDRIVRDRFPIHQAERGLLRPGRLRLCWRENGEPDGHGHKGRAQKRKSICDHGSFVPDWLSHVGEPSQCLVPAEPQPRLSS